MSRLFRFRHHIEPTISDPRSNHKLKSCLGGKWCIIDFYIGLLLNPSFYNDTTEEKEDFTAAALKRELKQRSEHYEHRSLITNDGDRHAALGANNCWTFIHSANFTKRPKRGKR